MDLTTQKPRNSRRRFAKWTAAIGSAILMSSAVSACGAENDASDGALNLQFGWLKNMQYGGPYMATEQGYYDDLGIEVNHLTGGPSVDTISVVTSGNADVGLSNSDELAVARGQGIPVVMLAAAFQRSPNSMISLAEAPVRTLEEQYGKTVAISDSTRPIVEALMIERGLDPARVNFVPKSDNPAVLADGQVDVYWGFITTEAAVLRARGVEVEAVPISDFGFRTYGNVYFTTEENLAEKREEIQKLVAADLAGWQWMVDNPVETAELTYEKYQEADEELDVVIEQSEAFVEVITAGDDELLYMDPAVVEANIQTALDSELIDEPVAVDQVLNVELLADARAEEPSGQ